MPEIHFLDRRIIPDFVHRDRTHRFQPETRPQQFLQIWCESGESHQVSKNITVWFVPGQHSAQVTSTDGSRQRFRGPREVIGSQFDPVRVCIDRSVRGVELGCRQRILDDEIAVNVEEVFF